MGRERDQIDAYEKRLVEDMRASLEAAQRMLDAFCREGSVSSIYNARTQAQQATQAAGELVGLHSALRIASE